jgi:hypothetical protein
MIDLLHQIWTFITTGDPERVAWIVIAFIVIFAMTSTFVYHMIDLLFGLLKKMFPLFTINRKEKIVKVPEYITPPQNEEIDKYIKILKKIADDYQNSIKL